MGRKSRKGEAVVYWCFYCEQEGFQDENTLIMHQKAKHFKCVECGKKMAGVESLRVHLFSVHKTTLKTVPNSVSGKEDINVQVYGMIGIPEEDGEKNASGSGGGGGADSKRPRVEVKNGGGGLMATSAPAAPASISPPLFLSHPGSFIPGAHFPFAQTASAYGQLQYQGQFPPQMSSLHPSHLYMQQFYSAAAAAAAAAGGGGGGGGVGLPAPGILPAGGSFPGLMMPPAPPGVMMFPVAPPLQTGVAAPPLSSTFIAACAAVEAAKASEQQAAAPAPPAAAATAANAESNLHPGAPGEVTVSCSGTEASATTMATSLTPAGAFGGALESQGVVALLLEKQRATANFTNTLATSTDPHSSLSHSISAGGIEGATIATASAAAPPASLPHQVLAWAVSEEISCEEFRAEWYSGKEPPTPLPPLGNFLLAVSHPPSALSAGAPPPFPELQQHAADLSELDKELAKVLG